MSFSNGLRSYLTTAGMVLGLMAYQVLWVFLMPVALLHLWLRGKKEPLYRQFIAERFASVSVRAQHSVWFHCASMGEMRGVTPLIQAVLLTGETVLISTLTPAGRTTALTVFKQEIEQGQLQVVYAPVEWVWVIARYVRIFKPKCAIMTEIDTWPALIMTLHFMGIPLALANAQYPQKSIVRDQRLFGFRAKIFAYYQLVLCKSNTHAQRFKSVGCKWVEIVGETRFDLPLPQYQVQAARQCLARWGIPSDPQLDQRVVICIASSVAGEDEQFIQAYQSIKQHFQSKGLPSPLFVHVPRSPQRFDTVFSMLEDAGFKVFRRSQCFDAHLNENTHPDTLNWSDVDVLLGDSLREMYFYLELSMVVVVGASFVPLGSHNIIEPLRLKKPVMVGPSIWGIEYPGLEALKAGVLQQQPNISNLVDALIALITHPKDYAQMKEKCEFFYNEHSGSTAKHLNILLPWLKSQH